ncbi:peroxisome proliferator-activated receptor gamma coactivator-related protein 1-like [Xenopus laevis]|uniref:Peroxisome proliferator-activated receptor gamma coactivator-related protein 1-like n=1 Tax=Xenopus laevis TaxID=8355 RepID=A0A8J1KXC4_XENLA|nr:peroxisome proliferator-activated receptor gamma coactivator-related protein 1-like [Xenopus laevis]XP_041421955.1 peroxisome proliferator-activated receptor gamma coactivator-related protein 1-like [Xenopus laevis]
MSGIQKVSADSAPGSSMDVSDRSSRLNEILRWAQFEAGEEDLLLLNRACLRSAAVTPTGSESPPSEEATSPAPPSSHSRAPAGHASLKRSSTRSAKPAAKRSHTAPPGRLARKKPPRTCSAPPLPTLDAAACLLSPPSTASSLMPPPIPLRPPAPPPRRKSATSGGTNRQPPLTPAGVCSAARPAGFLTALPSASGLVAPPPPPPLTATSSPPAASSSTTPAWPSMTPPPSLGPSAVAMGGAASSSALSSSSISSTVLDPEIRGSFRAVATSTAPVTAPQPGLALQFPPQNDLASVAVQENFSSQDIGQPLMVWIIGHSFVFHAKKRAEERPYGVNLGLENVNIVWMGVRGLKWDDMLPIALQMSTRWGIPAIITVHLGGNDIGSFRSIDLIRNIKRDLAQLRFLFPDSCIVWSEVIPRLIWLQDVRPLERCRKKVNFCISKFAKSVNILVHRHFELELGGEGLYWHDRVHLSDIGYDIFNMGIQDALEKAIKVWGWPRPN